MTIAARKLVVAPGNAHKTRGIARILGRFEVSSLVNHPPVEFPAEGGDYFVNARVKAIVAARAIGTACVADDSGLEVAALGGAPGAYSARYGGAGLDDRGRLEALLTALQSFPTPREARFFCAAAVALPDGRCQVAEGVCEGQILMQAKGDSGFGYDPIFLPEGQVRVMAELADVEKDGLSHRGRAFRALEPAIEELLAGWRE